MFRPRIIPVLLLKENVLVKSIQFKNHKYIGDPINAVKIFNDLNADEIVFLDISASQNKRNISLDFVHQVGEEANMPFAVGGGIKTLKDIQDIIAAGAEKIIINSSAAQNPDFIKEASKTFGSSTIVICIDVKKSLFKKNKHYINNGKTSTKYTPLEFAKLMEKNGAGEIIIQSIDKDGLMTGYDLELIESISKGVSIPVTALGGAGEIEDLEKCYKEAYATGLAAGSLFVYQSKRRGVLINYPEKEIINKIFK
ncbi:MAG: AglZ/HisF2 family acetamidino modification protein [Chitinophagales bacterium]